MQFIHHREAAVGPQGGRQRAGRGWMDRAAGRGAEWAYESGELLLDAKPDVNAHGEDGWIALLRVAENG